MSETKPESGKPLKPQSNTNKPEGPDSFGMPDLEFKPIKRGEPTPAPTTDSSARPTPPSEESKPTLSSKRAEKKEVKPSYTFEKPRASAKKPNRTFLIVSLVFIVLLSVSAVYLYLKSKDNGGDWMAVFKKGAEQAPIQEEEPSPAEEEMMIPEPSNTEAEIAVAQGPRYYVIVGGFSVPENAQRYKDNLTSEGHNAKVLEPTSSSPLHKVSVEDFPSLESALEARETLKQKFDLSIWVYKY